MNRSQIREINRTLSALSANSAVSRDSCEIALNRTLHEYRQATFQCPIFGNDLNVLAAANLADMVFRSGEDPERLAAILAGGLGNTMVGQIVSGMGIGRNQRKSELTFEKNRRLKTSFSVVRRFDTESDAIRSIGLGIIFGAESRVEIFFPYEMKDITGDVFSTKRHILLKMGNVSGAENVYYTRTSNSEKIESLSAICRHNQTQETAETLECATFPVFENENVEDWLGESFPGIGNRCVNLKSFRVSNNAIYAAFSTAAYNFLKLELGVGSTESRKRVSELNKWRDVKDIDKREMLPMIWHEELLAACEDGLDKMIVQTSMALSAYSVRDLYNAMQSGWDLFTRATLPSYETIWRRHKRLAEVVAGEGEDKMHRVSKETAQRVNTRKYNKKEKKKN